MNLYNKYILPRLLNLRMKRKDLNEKRKNVVEQAFGIVLEIGFGSGLNLPYYKNISKVYGLDPSLESYMLAKERIEIINSPFEYIQGSAEQIPLASGSVDCVVSTWNMCSIKNPEIALKEIFRVLKHEGKFIFIEHGKSDKRIVEILQNLFTPFSKLFLGGCHMNRDIENIINAEFKILNIDKSKEESKLLGFGYKGVAIKI